MNWCREESRQWQLLAMIERGVMIAPGGAFLTCVHHKKHLHSFDACWEHFTASNTWHLRELPSIHDLAENIHRSHTDEATEGSSALQRYFG